jgi:predicted MPP superfamily phosphohydrolase
VTLVNEPIARRSPAQPDYPAHSPPTVHPAAGPPPSPPSPSRREKLRQDPTFHTAWAVHPVAEYDPRCRPGPWFQFRLPDCWEWNRVELPVPNLPRALEGLRILHVSDFHLRRFWTPAYDELLARIGRNVPDLLLCTGDYVEDKQDYRPAMPMVMRLVAGFRGRLGCFSILGNHDKYAMTSRLRREGLTMLDGARHELRVSRGRGGASNPSEATIELIGLPGVDRSHLRDDFVRSVPRRREGTLRIVLSHFPSHLPRVQFDLQPDLFLTGHTHGGQICLPGGYPILRHDPSPRRLCTGIHWVGRTWLVVNRGFGFSGMQMRMFCPAEVLELTLTRMT